MAKNTTTNWKNAERAWSIILNKYGFTSKRKTRAGNYSESTFDVDIPEAPELKSDSKYSIKGFKTNRLYEVVKAKYCKDKGDEAILLTKGYKETGLKATVDAEFLAKLLAYWYLGRKE